ncbi:hemocytin-like [Ixodes scapularis]|uniref:hemocytin-like n=1 Tax=Ixodes scapularis TaxID=6945 RepID=UPI001C3838F7|nr:hemocytin-like [Ixodes scapularis]
MQVHTLGLFVGVDVFGGLAVFWDKHARVYVIAGPAWSDKLQGLCGNFNGDGTDDFRAPSGGPTLPDAIEFVNSWKLHPHCAPAVAQQDGCLAQPDRKKWAASQCQILREDLFRPCHSEVDVQPFYDRCVSDTCACDTGGDCECLCTAIGAYAHQCASRGVRVLWRSQELCPLQCDTCDEYSACVSFCKPPTCEHPVVHDACKVSPPLCLEGCTPALCPNGMVHRTATDRTCVPVQDCGVPPETACSIGGLHFKEGQRVATSNACQSCFCLRGEVRCVGKPCPIEVQVCVQTGWSDWESMNSPEYQAGNDFESLQAHGDHCPVEHMVAVECRTVGSKTPWNETGESVLCSPHTGLRCLREDQDDRELCSDYEMRVFCRCPEEEKRNECPPGSHWSDCGIRCNATCGPFLHKLQSEGFCASEESGCVPSCVSTDCQPDEFHFDKDTCVPVQHCPCLLPERDTPLAVCSETSRTLGVRPSQSDSAYTESN